MANRKAVYEIQLIADTTSLISQLQKAGKSLEAAAKKPGLTQDLQQASAAALDLATNLQKAINPTTGKFDILTFSQSISKAKDGLQGYYQQISKLGTQGQQAFFNVAQAIAKAEPPLLRTNKLMSGLWTTMKNTMRWQLTTSMLHGFLSSISTAYGYAKDLDESLNNIRIVTGKSVDEMREFAVQANEAAKALNTTTVEFSDAALIYAQQGN